MLIFSSFLCLFDISNRIVLLKLQTHRANTMACPFVQHANSLRRQSSVVVEQNSNWGIEDDFAEIPDALTLTHLQAAIQLLTSPLVRLCLLARSVLIAFPQFLFAVDTMKCLIAIPSLCQNEDVNTAVNSLITKYQGKWPGLCKL